MNSKLTDTPQARGVQDTSGMGLLGLVVGVIVGFMIAFYLVIPLFPKNDSTFTITLLTVIAVVMATAGGTLGYLATRRRMPAGLDGA